MFVVLMFFKGFQHNPRKGQESRAGLFGAATSARVSGIEHNKGRCYGGQNHSYLFGRS
jgi:hypothetical protein